MSFTTLFFRFDLTISTYEPRWLLKRKTKARLSLLGEQRMPYVSMWIPPFHRTKESMYWLNSVVWRNKWRSTRTRRCKVFLSLQAFGCCLCSIYMCAVCFICPASLLLFLLHKYVYARYKKKFAVTVKGKVLFEVALDERLKLMNVSRRQLDACLAQQQSHLLTPNADKLIASLRQRKVTVYLVSGGFHQMIAPIADALKISRDNVFANTLLFNDDGSFKGFDASEPTSKSGGKKAVVQSLIEKHKHKHIVMIGDGVTDMEARPPAQLFVGFGGVHVRDTVQKGADWFVTDFQTLIDAL
jgi:phosphoserine phosphatase